MKRKIAKVLEYIVSFIILNIILHGTCFSLSISFGTESIFNNGVTWPVSAAPLDENHVIIAYSDWEDGNTYGNGKAVIATISGINITYGPEYQFNSYSQYVSVAALDANHAIIVYKDGYLEYGRARVATITGDSISYGYKSPYTVNNGEVFFNTVTALDATHALIGYAFVDDYEYKYGHVSFVTIIDTDILYESDYMFNYDGTYDISITTLDVNKAFIAYRDPRGASFDYGTAVVASIYGTNVTCGSEYVFNATPTYYVSASSLDNTHAILAYQDGGNSSYGSAKIATISGSSISYGSEYVFNYRSTGEIDIYSLSPNYALIAYTDIENSDYCGNAIIAEIVDTDISFSNEYTFNTARPGVSSIAPVDDNTALIAYQDYGNEDYGTGIVAEISTFGINPEIESEIRFSENKLINYPNPFSSSTTIEYGISCKLKTEPIEIRIYNILGQLVKTIEATNGITELDMSEMIPGIYLYEIRSTNYCNVQKMILIK